MVRCPQILKNKRKSVNEGYGGQRKHLQILLTYQNKKKKHSM